MSARRKGIAAGDLLVVASDGTVRRATRYQTKVKRRRVLGMALTSGARGDLVTVSIATAGAFEVVASDGRE